MAQPYGFVNSAAAKRQQPGVNPPVQQMPNAATGRPGGQMGINQPGQPPTMMQRPNAAAPRPGAQMGINQPGQPPTMMQRPNAAMGRPGGQMGINQPGQPQPLIGGRPNGQMNTAVMPSPAGPQAWQGRGDPTQGRQGGQMYANGFVNAPPNPSQARGQSGAGGMGGGQMGTAVMPPWAGSMYPQNGSMYAMAGNQNQQGNGQMFAMGGYQPQNQQGNGQMFAMGGYQPQNQQGNGQMMANNVGAPPPGPDTPSYNWGNWNGGVPNIPPMGPPQNAQPAQNWANQNFQMPDWIGNTRDWWKDGGNQAALGAWAQMMQPWAQMQQNASQYGQDFNEAQRRWNSQFGWQQQGDTFNMNLSQRQQNASEWQMNEAARQWGQQFQYQRGQDNRTWDLSNRQLSQQDRLAMAEMANQKQIATMQAYGREQAPNARFVRSW